MNNLKKMHDFHSCQKIEFQFLSLPMRWKIAGEVPQSYIENYIESLKQIISNQYGCSIFGPNLKIDAIV